MQPFASLFDPSARLVPRRTRLLRRGSAIAAALALHGAILAALTAMPRAHPPVADRPLIVPVELAYLAPAAVPAARPSNAPAAAESPPRPAEPETRAVAPRPTPVAAEPEPPAPPPPRPAPPRPARASAPPPLPAPIPVAAPAHLAAAAPVAALARAKMESGSVSAPEAATNAGTVTTPASSPSVPQWEGAVLARLDRFRRYPYAARLRQQEGVVYLRMTVGPHGEVLSSGVQRSSGIAALDEETKSLAARAAPLPAPPPELSGAPVELVVPIRYVLR